MLRLLECITAQAQPRPEFSFQRRVEGPRYLMNPGIVDPVNAYDVQRQAILQAGLDLRRVGALERFKIDHGVVGGHAVDCAHFLHRHANEGLQRWR